MNEAGFFVTSAIPTRALRLGAFYPEENKANTWIISARRFFRTNFIIQGECVHNVCSCLLFAAKANISRFDHTQREKRHGYRNLHFYADFRLALSLCLREFHAITVFEYRTRHYVIHTLFPEYPRYHSGATKN